MRAMQNTFKITVLKSHLNAKMRASLMAVSAFMLAAFLTMGASMQSVSAKSITVLAVVNGAPISSIDFEERRNFLIKTTGIEYNDNTKDQIDRDVLQMLVDDIIKINAGLAFGAGFETSARQRASELVRASFSQNGEDPEAVMKSLGIDPEVAEKKFLADVLWASTVQSKFAKQFSNTREEAEKELERVKKNVQKPHLNIDEIVLVPEPNRNFATTQRLAEQIYNALTKGADFGRIAQQYSATGSGRDGGKLGWVLAERLPDQIRTILEGAPSGAFTKPVVLDGAIVIYRVNGKRLNGQTDVMENQVHLARLLYPIDTTDKGKAEEGRMTVAKDIQSVKTCDDLYALHNSYGSSTNPDLGRFRVMDFAPVMRQVITGLGQNERTGIISFSEGLVVFMVCELNIPQLDLPSIEEIETNIRNRHYTALSARLMSRLRKKAIITYKDTP